MVGFSSPLELDAQVLGTRNLRAREFPDLTKSGCEQGHPESVCEVTGQRASVTLHSTEVHGEETGKELSHHVGAVSHQMGSGRVTQPAAAMLKHPQGAPGKEEPGAHAL